VEAGGFSRQQTMMAPFAFMLMHVVLTQVVEPYDRNRHDGSEALLMHTLEQLEFSKTAIDTLKTLKVPPRKEDRRFIKRVHVRTKPAKVAKKQPKVVLHAHMEGTDNNPTVAEDGRPVLKLLGVANDMIGWSTEDRHGESFKDYYTDQGATCTHTAFGMQLKIPNVGAKYTTQSNGNVHTITYTCADPDNTALQAVPVVRTVTTHTKKVLKPTAWWKTLPPRKVSPLAAYHLSAAVVHVEDNALENDVDHVSANIKAVQLALQQLNLSKKDIAAIIAKYPDCDLAKAQRIIHADLAATLFQKENHLASPAMSLILQEIHEALPKLVPTPAPTLGPTPAPTTPTSSPTHSQSPTSSPTSSPTHANQWKNYAVDEIVSVDIEAPGTNAEGVAMDSKTQAIANDRTPTPRPTTRAFAVFQTTQKLFDDDGEMFPGFSKGNAGPTSQPTPIPDTDLQCCPFLDCCR
jgi:hypothetical protein